jgi:hypothetical protein
MELPRGSSEEPIDRFAAEMDALPVHHSGQTDSRAGEMGLRDMRIVLVVIERARLDGQPVTVPTS